MSNTKEQFEKLVAELIKFASDNKIPLLVSNGAPVSKAVEPNFQFYGNVPEFMALVSQAAIVGSNHSSQGNMPVFASIIKELTAYINMRAIAVVSDSMFDEMPTKGGIN